MLLRDLFESQQMLTLYRGDATKVDTFSTEHTRNSWGLLFGMGIYLTDNPSVALDYTIKGGFRPDGSGTVLVRDQASKTEAVRMYLNIIMARELGWIEKRESIKTEWIQRWHNETRDTDFPRHGTPEYDEYKRREAEYHDEFRAAVKKEMASYLARAKVVYKKQRLYAYEDTLGKWSIVHPDHQGHMTRFEIPEAYCENTLHGDRPLSDKELAILKDFFMEHTKGHLDFRNRNNEFVSSWDEWIEVFRSEGTRYAWNDIYVGGEGENPTLDQIWNGTHGGLSAMDKFKDEFIATMRSHGYNGIEYEGGKRLGSNIRGGGGLTHRAFVFWDDAYINSCRVETSPSTYGDLDLPLGKIRTTGMARGWVEPDKHGNIFSD